MSDNQFGYVEVKDGRVVCHVEDPNNPTVYKFENDEIVEAVTLWEQMKPIMMEHVGEDGDNEGAVELLKRLCRNSDLWRNHHD